MKINVTNSIIFVTKSFATSHIDDIKNDVADDIAMMWMAIMMCKLTWLLAWKVVLMWQLTWIMR